MAEHEKYYIPVKGKMVEVSKKVYQAFYKHKNREEYLEKRDSNKVFSFNALDTENSTGESLMPDMEDSSPEDQALARELLAQLHRCIAHLPKAERELIKALYFDGMSETEYASKGNLTQSGISRKHKKILEKLRILMNNLGSFLFFVILIPVFYHKG